MGKVIAGKIISINRNETIVIKRDEPLLFSADDPLHRLEFMHLDEEMVLVFDQNGKCVGNMEHQPLTELQ